MLSDEQARELCTWHRGVLRAARPLDAGSTSRHPPGQKHAARDERVLFVSFLLPPSRIIASATLWWQRPQRCTVLSLLSCDDARGRTEGHRARTRRGRKCSWTRHPTPVPSCLSLHMHCCCVFSGSWCSLPRNVYACSVCVPRGVQPRFALRCGTGCLRACRMVLVGCPGCL